MFQDTVSDVFYFITITITQINRYFLKGIEKLTFLTTLQDHKFWHMLTNQTSFWKLWRTALKS